MSPTLEQAVLNGAMQTGPTPWTVHDVFWCMVMLIIVTFAMIKFREWRMHRGHHVHAQE